MEATALQAAVVEMERLVKGKSEGTASEKELRLKFEDLEDALNQAVEAVQTLRPQVEKETAESSEEETVSMPPELAKKVAERIVGAAEMGDVSQVKSIAEELKAESPVFSNICDKFIQLAEDFDFDGVLNLARQLND